MFQEKQYSNIQGVSVSERTLPPPLPTVRPLTGNVPPPLPTGKSATKAVPPPLAKNSTSKGVSEGAGPPPIPPITALPPPLTSRVTTRFSQDEENQPSPDLLYFRQELESAASLRGNMPTRFTGHTRTMNMEIYVALGREQKGPFDISLIQSMVASRQISTTDLAWAAGEPEWIALSAFAQKHNLALTSQDAIDTSAQPKPKLPMGSGRRPRCTKCRSENVELVSSVIEAGTSTRTTEGSGGAYVNGRWVTVSTSDVEIVKTDLAERLEEEVNDLLVSGSWAATVSSIAACCLSAYVSYKFGGQGWLSHVLYFLGPFFVIVAILMATGLIDKWEIVDAKANVENEKINKRLYCHACGKSFSPE